MSILAKFSEKVIENTGNTKYFKLYNDIEELRHTFRAL